MAWHTFIINKFSEYCIYHNEDHKDINKSIGLASDEMHKNFGSYVSYSLDLIEQIEDHNHGYGIKVESSINVASIHNIDHMKDFSKKISIKYFGCSNFSNLIESIGVIKTLSPLMHYIDTKVKNYVCLNDFKGCNIINCTIHNLDVSLYMESLQTYKNEEKFQSLQTCKNEA